MNVIASVLMLIGVVGFSVVCFTALKNIAASKWPSVDGELLSIEYDENEGEFCHQPQVSYCYIIGANTFYSKRFAFSFLSNKLRFEVVSEIDKIFDHDHIKVYYHPRKPHLSVLQVGIRAPHLILGAAFFAMIVVSQILAW